MDTTTPTSTPAIKAAELNVIAARDVVTQLTRELDESRIVLRNAEESLRTLQRDEDNG